MTALDTPRTYRIPGKWGWFFTLSERERADVCFPFGSELRLELEELETLFLVHEGGSDYNRAAARVKVLEELLEPAAA